MTGLAANADRLLYLAAAVCDKGASQDDLDELDAVLLVDKDARRRFLDFCHLHFTLGLELRADWIAQKVHQQIDLKPGLAILGSSAVAIPATAPAVSAPSPVPTSFLRPTLAYFSDGLPLAYLLATVITGLGLLIAGLVHVSGPEQIVQHVTAPVVEPQPAYCVGRITGIVEGSGFRVQGSGSENQKLEMRNQKSVHLGDRFDLSSGLLEITYNTGAKVILQGPVAYQVESNGGYLSLGKLVGKFEKKNSLPSPSGRGAGGEGLAASEYCKSPNLQISKSPSPSSNPQSLIPNPFVVHTPTATVTDLGTEFGVEVGADGVTKTQVFVGSVNVVVSGDRNNGPKERVVRAGSAVCVDSKVTPIQPSGLRFVRILPSVSTASSRADAYAELVLSMKPVVYYRMEEWPKDEKRGGYILVDSASGAHHGELHVDEAFGSPKHWHRQGRFGGELEFRGPMANKDNNYAIVRDYPKAANGQLSVSAWVWPSTFDRNMVIAHNWSETDKGGRVGQFYLGTIQTAGNLYLSAVVRQQYGGEVYLSKDLIRTDAPVLARCEWQHVALVADGAMLRLYRNGVELGAVPCLGVAVQTNPKGLGIGCLSEELVGANLAKAYPGLWNGRLDEIAVFNHALRAEQVRQLYTGAIPALKLPAATSVGERNPDGATGSPMGENGGADKHY